MKPQTEDSMRLLRRYIFSLLAFLFFLYCARGFSQDNYNFYIQKGPAPHMVVQGGQAGRGGQKAEDSVVTAGPNEALKAADAVTAAPAPAVIDESKPAPTTTVS